MIRSHGYDPRTNDSDNEERGEGGVHINGYLRPINAKTGWLGRGSGRSKTYEVKRRRTGKSKKEEDTDAST